MNKRQIASTVVFYGLLGKDMYHGAQIRQGVYKVEVKFVLMLEITLPFLNHHDDPPQEFLVQMKNQFTLWVVVNMCKAKFFSHALRVL
jgi:hypothetical protein